MKDGGSGQCMVLIDLCAVHHLGQVNNGMQKLHKHSLFGEAAFPNLILYNGRRLQHRKQ